MVERMIFAFLCLFLMEVSTGWWHLGYPKSRLDSISFILAMVQVGLVSGHLLLPWYIFAATVAAQATCRLWQVLWDHEGWMHRQWIEGWKTFTWWHLVGGTRHLFTCYALYVACRGDYYWLALWGLVLLGSTKAVWRELKLYYRPEWFK